MDVFVKVQDDFVEDCAAREGAARGMMGLEIVSERS
jgi:hypothetical protein